jgi:hypothetical protein
VGKRLATRRSVHWRVAVLPSGELLFLVHLSPSGVSAPYACHCGNFKEIELSSAMISEEEFMSDFFCPGVKVWVRYQLTLVPTKAS